MCQLLGDAARQHLDASELEAAAAAAGAASTEAQRACVAAAAEAEQQLDKARYAARRAAALHCTLQAQFSLAGAALAGNCNQQDNVGLLYEAPAVLSSAAAASGSPGEIAPALSDHQGVPVAAAPGSTGVMARAVAGQQGAPPAAAPPGSPGEVAPANDGFDGFDDGDDQPVTAADQPSSSLDLVALFTDDDLQSEGSGGDMP